MASNVSIFVGDVLLCRARMSGQEVERFLIHLRKKGHTNVTVVEGVE